MKAESDVRKGPGPKKVTRQRSTATARRPAVEVSDEAAPRALDRPTDSLAKTVPAVAPLAEHEGDATPVVPGVRDRKLIYDPETDTYYGGPDLTWRGTTWGAVGSRLQERSITTEAQALQHDKAASAWRRVVRPLAWLTAALAAVSGLSVVATNEVAALFFSIATALVAATNAALDPAGTERAHRAAAHAYDRLRMKLDDYAYFTVQEFELPVPSDELKSVRDKLKEFDDELRQIADAAPGARVDLRPGWSRQVLPEEQVR